MDRKVRKRVKRKRENLKRDNIQGKKKIKNKRCRGGMKKGEQEHNMESKESKEKSKEREKVDKGQHTRKEKYKKEGV